MYNFVEVSGHNIESNLRFPNTRGGGVKPMSRGSVNSKEENSEDLSQLLPRIRPLVNLPKSFSSEARMEHLIFCRWWRRRRSGSTGATRSPLRRRTSPAATTRLWTSSGSCSSSAPGVQTGHSHRSWYSSLNRGQEMCRKVYFARVYTVLHWFDADPDPHFSNCGSGSGFDDLKLKKIDSRKF